MEKKEMGVSVKSEDVIVDSSSSLLNGYQFSSVFDFCEVERSSSLGFMELLGGQDYTPLLDVPTMSAVTHNHNTVKSSSEKECSEVLNQQQPATPNSCSISSASSEAVNDNKIVVNQAEEDEEEEEKQKTNKQWVFFPSNFLFFVVGVFTQHFYFSCEEKGQTFKHFFFLFSYFFGGVMVFLSFISFHFISL
jgi:hypothetical protein